MKKIVRRVGTAVLTGFIISLAGFIFLGKHFGYQHSITWGFLLWYTFIGLLIGIVGVIDKHPIFGFHMKILRGILIAGILNLALGLMAMPYFEQLFVDYTFGLPIALALLLEGALVGAIIDAIATKLGGEGKGLLK